MALQFQSPRFQGDPLLLQILNDPDTGQLKLGPGSPAGSVTTLQQALFDLGWTLRIDPPFPDPAQFIIGIYGPVTTKTVLAYKTHHNITFPPTGTIDGFAGPRTFQALDRDCVAFDASVVAIEAKAADLEAAGDTVELNMTPPSTVIILGTRTAARQAFINGDPGAIYHNASLGAFEVHGPIFEDYIDRDGPAGDLGSPLSDVHQDDGFLRSDFENGSLRLDPATGVVELLEPPP
jgi:hypothetical protein